MSFWNILFLTFFLRPAEARVGIMDVSEEVPLATIAGVNSSTRDEKESSTPVPLVERVIPSPRDEEEDSISVSLVEGERSATPGANTPGGGVPRLREELLLPVPQEVSWWEQWWEVIKSFFCEGRDAS